MTFLTGVICAVLALTATSDVSAAPSPPSTTRQNGKDPLTTHDPDLYLFVDDFWIAEQHGLARINNRPRALPEPIICPDDPRTERECAWGNVLRERDGRFRLWYTTMMMGHEAAGAHEMAKAGVWGRGDEFSFHPRSAADVRETECMLGRYAESTDGIHWTKPALGLIEFRDSRRNNIVLTGERAARQTDGALTNVDGFTVVRDDAERDPARRYKMVAHWESVHFWDEHEYSGRLGRPPAVMEKYAKARGKYLTFSPDGLRWDQPLVRLRVDGQGDRCLVVRDHRNARWRLYNRPANGYAAAGLATSPDLEHWTPTEPVLARESPGHPDIESLIPFNYGNQDLGFLITQLKGKAMLSYLVSHHDGQPWKRVARVPDEPFIPPGPTGSYWASGAVPLHNEPLVVGDELLVVFNAFAYNQGPPCKGGSRTIGIARLRRDAFVGLRCAPNAGAGDGAGYLLTRPIKLSRPRLYLNVEQRGGGGTARVSLHHPDGTAIAGFAPDDAVPITADAVRQPVTWRGRQDVSELRGQEVRVRIALTGEAVLYSLSFGDG